MADFLVRVLLETWDILKEASVFLLFGFLLAGLLATLVPARLLSRLLGTGKVKSVLWASALGAPLPLCSCGVLPTAVGLRKQGATPGATVAFLISTPETGVDSISMTYALMDPIITVLRPVFAVVTAITAGLATNFFGVRRPRGSATGEPAAAIEAHHEGSASELQHAHGHEHGHDHGPTAGPHLGDDNSPDPSTRAGKVRRAAAQVYRYAFRDLLDDTSYWLLLGIVLSGVVAAALPQTFFEQYAGSGLLSMLVMLAIGIPIYTCASASTPLAAALVMKGLNPGAAMVFLLSGPATNLGSLVVLLKFLGVRILAIYLASIVAVTLAAGYTLNWIYSAWGIDPRASFGAASAFIPEPVKVAAALVMIALLVLSMRRTHVPDEWVWLRDRCARLTGLRLTARRLALGAAAVVVGLYAGSGLFQVQPGEVGVRLRFGEALSPVLAPGLHFRLPWPFEAHQVVPQDRVQRIEFGLSDEQTRSAPAQRRGFERMMGGWNPMAESANTSGTWFRKDAADDEPFLLTGDGNLIDLRWAVQYRIKDPMAFAFSVAEPEGFVRAVSRTALRGVVARTGIDAIYTSERSSVEEQAQRALQDILDRAHTGVEVIAFQLLYVHPPAEVHDAFRDVASAQEDKLRTVNRASIFAVEAVNQAKGEAAAMVEGAQAFREQQILRAEGDAASFLLRLDAYRHAPELTRFRLQVETVEATLPGLQKFVRPGAGEMKDFDMWLLQPVGASRGK